MNDREAPLIAYGTKEDGPVFERLCPKCARFLKFPDTMKWQENFHGMCTFADLECSKCGTVKPTHVGWAGDFYE